MSEGSVFVRGSDGRACATYKDARGKTRYLYAKTKPEVRRKLRQALRESNTTSHRGLVSSISHTCLRLRHVMRKRSSGSSPSQTLRQKEGKTSSQIDSFRPTSRSKSKPSD